MYAYNKVFVNYLSENSFSDVHSFQGLELGEDTAADVTEFFAAADCSEKKNQFIIKQCSVLFFESM